MIESKPINAVEQMKSVSVIPGASTLVNVQYMHITRHISHPSTPETLFALTALSAENISTKKSFIVIFAIVVNRIHSILPLRRRVSLATMTCVSVSQHDNRRCRTNCSVLYLCLLTAGCSNPCTYWILRNQALEACTVLAVLPFPFPFRFRFRLPPLDRR